MVNNSVVSPIIPREPSWRANMTTPRRTASLGGTQGCMYEHGDHICIQGCMGIEVQQCFKPKYTTPKKNPAVLEELK